MSAKQERSPTLPEAKPEVGRTGRLRLRELSSGRSLLRSDRQAECGVSIIAGELDR
jgi:hypothetical protein